MLHLPEHISGQQPLTAGNDREWAVIGANGAGKARFALRMRELAEGESIGLSPVSNRFPATPGPGLSGMLKSLAARPDQARRAAAIWRKCFPESEMILSRRGNIRFRNTSGTDTFGYTRLSRGEKSAAYFLSGVLTAPPDSLLFIDSPTLFLHPSAVAPLWDSLTAIRKDCRFIFITSDPVFLSARRGMRTIWIRRYFNLPEAWDYTIVEGEEYSDELMLELMGTRRSILFIEGDATHSIDARLYGALFPEYHVRPVGSCNKVIEATRTFSSMRSIHHLESHGLVDRDRRTEAEVDYLRLRGVLVPEVAEVENLFLSEGVLANMALMRNVSPRRVVRETRRHVTATFIEKMEGQALEHVRHRMKRDVERKIDARFTCLTALELHIKGLINQLRPRQHYTELLKQFRQMAEAGDYAAILRVFNHKPLLTQSPAFRLLRYPTAEAYVNGVIEALRKEGEAPRALRDALRLLFIPSDGDPAKLKDSAKSKDSAKYAGKPASRSEHSDSHGVRTYGGERNRHREEKEKTRKNHKYKKRR